MHGIFLDLSLNKKIKIKIIQLKVQCPCPSGSGMTGPRVSAPDERTPSIPHR